MGTTGLQLGAGSIALGALGKASPAAAPITGSVTTGFSKFAGVFPTVGALAGTTLTIQQAGKVVKATRKLKKKRRK